MTSFIGDDIADYVIRLNHASRITRDFMVLYDETASPQQYGRNLLHVWPEPQERRKQRKGV